MGLESTSSRRIPLGILAIVAVLLAAFALLTPNPDPDELEPQDRPALAGHGQRRWQQSRVRYRTGSATLAEAMAKFGGIEGWRCSNPKTGR